MGRKRSVFGVWLSWFLVVLLGTPSGRAFLLSSDRSSLERTLTSRRRDDKKIEFCRSPRVPWWLLVCSFGEILIFLSLSPPPRACLMIGVIFHRYWSHPRYLSRLSVSRRWSNFDFTTPQTLLLPGSVKFLALRSHLRNRRTTNTLPDWQFTSLYYCSRTNHFFALSLFDDQIRPEQSSIMK